MTDRFSSFQCAFASTRSKPLLALNVARCWQYPNVGVLGVHGGSTKTSNHQFANACKRLAPYLCDKSSVSPPRSTSSAGVVSHLSVFLSCTALPQGHPCVVNRVTSTSSSPTNWVSRAATSSLPPSTSSTQRGRLPRFLSRVVATNPSLSSLNTATENRTTSSSCLCRPPSPYPYSPVPPTSASPARR